MFLFSIYILKAFHAYEPFQVRFLKERPGWPAILNGDVKGKNRGIQLNGPTKSTQ